MGTQQDVETKVVTLKDGRTRQFRSKQLRRQIVEETLKRGASVALVARTHGVNTNQVLKWRRQYERGRLEVNAHTALLPVKVSGTNALAPILRRKHRPRRSGIIDIDLGHARVRIEGTADPDCVRAALEGLLR
jgi:transposase